MLLEGESWENYDHNWQIDGKGTVVWTAILTPDYLQEDLNEVMSCAGVLVQKLGSRPRSWILQHLSAVETDLRCRRDGAVGEVPWPKSMADDQT